MWPSDSDAIQIGNDLVDSECLVGLERDEVQGLLGGDGESYYLGFPALAIDTESLVVVYQDGVVEEAHLVQG